MTNKINLALAVIFLLLFSIPTILGGIGIKSYQESVLANENEEACVVVGAYNPFPTGTTVEVSVSEELEKVLVLQEAENKYLPPFTSSDNAIPLNFCFKVPEVYSRDYAIAGKFIDKLDCDEPQQVYEGEVVLESVAGGDGGGGIGGSATKMSVSRPLRVRVNCSPYSWNYTPAYLLGALISILIIGFVLFTKYRKPKEIRIKEKMKKLKEEMKSSKKK
jgi:hypothetical protein